MTSKEEANELVITYWKLLNANMLLAKKCAKIAVDRILYAISEDHTFWEEVKKEIEKL